MAVIRLDIADFRNFVSAKIEPISCGFNFLYGNNGSGKTSLLEAIYYLSLGRSFRSSTISRVIRQAADKFSLFAQILRHSDQNIPIGIERHQDGDIKLRISGKDIRSIAELANLTPVQLINSNCYNLLDAPGFRRKYLDWGSFYLSSDFLRYWKQFERALKQRNAALRGQLSRHELSVWTQELIDHAVQLDQIRRDYVRNLMPILSDIIKSLLPLYEVDICYQSGWDVAMSYQDSLAKSLERDSHIGYTQCGPHRADFKININGMPAKDILSRGQQKLFVCAMLVAQGALLQIDTNRKPVYLVDDLPSELDLTSRCNLMTLLSRQNAQVFVTAVERETLDSFLGCHPMKMFHVEHGSITEVA